MNKRFAIGLLIVASGAVTLAIVSIPKEGSARWHEREYAAAIKELEGKTLSQRVSRLWGKISGRPVKRLQVKQFQQLQRKLEEHRRELVKAGYLVERRFSVTNRDAR